MRWLRPTRTALLVVLVPLAALLLVLGLVAACRTGQAAAVVQYHCPMRPDYVSDRPGDCPICGMRLVPMEKEAAAAPAATADRKALFYRNPMDASVTSPVPAKDGMGMDYVPVYAEAAAEPAAGGLPGMAAVQPAPAALRLAGVKTAVAERRTLSRSVRAVGLVTADETRVRHVHTKISGWIEHLHVNSTGQAVRAGQPLLALYSPQLLATQEEYLRAREAAARFAGSSLPEVRQGGADILSAARRRLELFDVPRSLLAELDRTGKPQRTVTLLAPVSGYVTGKDIFEGMEVGPGMDLLTITDLSRVWVEADFYEFESRRLATGQKVTLYLPYDPHVHLAGRVSFIYPTLDAESRTLKARIEYANPSLQLKPGMYVDISPELEASEGVVIPDSAVIDSGLRKVVFVERGGAFEPREVRVGSRSAGQALILEGVAAGERVAVRANFLLDSESRLRAIAGMNGSHEHNGGGGR